MFGGTVVLKKRALDQHPSSAEDPVYSDLGPNDAPMKILAQIRKERGLQKAQQDQLRSPLHSGMIKARETVCQTIVHDADR